MAGLQLCCAVLCGYDGRPAALNLTQNSTGWLTHWGEAMANTSAGGRARQGAVVPLLSNMHVGACEDNAREDMRGHGACALPLSNGHALAWDMAPCLPHFAWNCLPRALIIIPILPMQRCWPRTRRSCWSGPTPPPPSASTWWGGRAPGGVRCRAAGVCGRAAGVRGRAPACGREGGTRDGRPLQRWGWEFGRASAGAWVLLAGGTSLHPPLSHRLCTHPPSAAPPLPLPLQIHGGTNFGFWAGANVDGGRYLPHITSYDYDAPISGTRGIGCR